MNAFAHRAAGTPRRVVAGPARALGRLGASVAGTCAVLVVLASVADRIA